MSKAQDAMKKLNAQWYNCLTSQLGFAGNTFQLVQGYSPVGTNMEWLWNILDAVPPLSVDSYYNPSQLSRFSQNYAGMLSALMPATNYKLQKDLGDTYYNAWTEYKGTLSPVPQGTLAWAKAFANWANAKLPQNMVEQAIGDYNTMLQDPVTVAKNEVTEVQYSPTHKGVFAYDVTYNQLQMDLNNAPSKAASFNSTTESSDISNTWAKTQVSGLVDIFSGAGSATYSRFTTELTSAGINIHVSFDKLVTLAAGPLIAQSSDPLLKPYAPWFNSAALHEAYASKSNTLWKPTSPITWESTFGRNGNLLRNTSALVIVDGITLTMVSGASIAKSDRQDFSAAVSGGIWPFFSVSGQAGWTRTTTFNDDGKVVVTSKCAPNNPQLLGVIVTPITSIFGSSAAKAA